MIDIKLISIFDRFWNIAAKINFFLCFPIIIDVSQALIPIFTSFCYLCSANSKRTQMDNHSLLAVSPIDGRYSRQTEPLREYFSEYALIKYRVRVEIEYFIALCQIPLPQLADFIEIRGAQGHLQKHDS